MAEAKKTQTTIKKPQPKHSQKAEETVSFTPKMLETGEVKTLLSWQAPSRPFRKKDKSYYFTSALIVVLLILILLLMNQFLLIAVLLSLLFVTYALAFVPPGDVNYRISTQGITIGEDFYFWHFLNAFWFREKDGFKILVIPTYFRFPAQLMLVLPTSSAASAAAQQADLGEVDEEKLKKTVARFLPFVEVPYKSMMEKWSEGLQKNFPLEHTKK